MGNSNKTRSGQSSAAHSSAAVGVQYTAADVARLRNGAKIPAAANVGQGALHKTLSMAQTSKLFVREHDALALRVVICVVAIVVLAFFSLCFMGAAGQNYPYAGAYQMYTPVQVAGALYERAYNVFADATGMFSRHSNDWILENVPGYWAIWDRAGVVGITIICSLLLGISGMLYQNAFKNPIAGPGMLGATSGVSLGMMIMVYLYSSAATSMLGLRYAICYGAGAAILAFVLIAGRKLSGKDKPFDITTMLLVGSILSQLLGFVVSYITLFLMDEADYLTYYTMSQMLVVDTSTLSWIVLGIACAVSLIPVYICRYKFNGLAMEMHEARMLGLNYTRLRVIALLCGAIMILAASIHIGAVSLVSLIVPFLSRSLFGCESSRQLIGNMCIGPILLLICRDITDVIPFIADGLSIGSIASVVMLPLFVVVMARQMRGWE